MNIPSFTVVLAVLATSALPADRPTVSPNKAVPAIASLSPNAIVVRSTGITLTVRGTGFSRNATVRWNGADRATTYVSDGELQASIATADLATLGTYPVSVNVSGGQGGISNQVPFTVGNPVPTLVSYSPATVFMAGAEPFTLTVSGTNFVAGATVRWNGVALSPPPGISISGNTTLHAWIPTSLLVPGPAYITVVNPAPALGPSNTRTVQVAHLVPSIATLSPAKIIEDSGRFELLVNGQNFVRDTSYVRWNNSHRPTTFVSSTQLKAVIEAADIANQGVANITVATYITQYKKTSSAVSFLIGLRR